MVSFYLYDKYSIIQHNIWHQKNMSAHDHYITLKQVRTTHTRSFTFFGRNNCTSLSLSPSLFPLPRSSLTLSLYLSFSVICLVSIHTGSSGTDYAPHPVAWLQTKILTLSSQDWQHYVEWIWSIWWNITVQTQNTTTTDWWQKTCLNWIDSYVSLIPDRVVLPRHYLFLIAAIFHVWNQSWR